MALTKGNAVLLKNGVRPVDIISVDRASSESPKQVGQMILQLESRRAEITDRLVILRKLQKRLTN